MKMSIYIIRLQKSSNSTNPFARRGTPIHPQWKRRRSVMPVLRRTPSLHRLHQTLPTSLQIPIKSNRRRNRAFIFPIEIRQTPNGNLRERSRSRVYEDGQIEVELRERERERERERRRSRWRLSGSSLPLVQFPRTTAITAVSSSLTENPRG
ncbi:hypothetical protein F2Q68_00029055 [Brassica cretica]|uniref:Uncharacterized protein n=1 Tax=Brassica cretica TaxID=69181 RepID=A0A8S9GGY7_BRACR|nr:hypothetical protein F2Q68_00029055 [Brassica cretica]